MDELTTEECLALLEEQTVAHIGVISEGEPYVGAISYVVDEGDIAFRTAGGRRLDAIRANPQVCIEVSTYEEKAGDWQSVIVWGDARLVEDEGRVSRITSALIDKYADALGSLIGVGPKRPILGEPTVVVVGVDKMTGRTSGRYLSQRERPGRF